MTCRKDEPKKTLRVLLIYMSESEWSCDENGRIMERLAEEGFNMIEPRPEYVIVREHGGWFLGYAEINGKVKIVSSANDQAVFDEDVKRWCRDRRESRWEITEIRRQAGVDNFKQNVVRLN